MPAMRSFGTAAIATPVAPSSDVVIPDLVDTLEWVLDSPPNVHQFEEPPVSESCLFLSDAKLGLTCMSSCPLYADHCGSRALEESESV